MVLRTVICLWKRYDLAVKAIWLAQIAKHFNKLWLYFDTALVSAGIELNFFIEGDTGLCSGFFLIMLVTR